MVSTLYTVHWHCTGLDARWPLDKYLCIDIRKWDIEQKLRWYPRFVAKHWPAHDGAPPAGCGGGALLIPQEVISHSPWRPHPLHTTHLGGGSPGALWGSLVNLSDLGWRLFIQFLFERAFTTTLYWGELCIIMHYGIMVWSNRCSTIFKHCHCMYSVAIWNP